MAAMPAEATVRIDGSRAIVDLSGDINRDAEPVLMGAYEEAMGAGSQTLLLNFAATEFINSTGIAVIVGILARARQEQITVNACGLTEHYEHIFKITRLADFMPMFPDEQAALSSAT
jgi:anti-sigma B factor antagonist